MNSFDAAILHFINGFAHKSWTCDRIVIWLTADEFQKGGIIALLLWWAWFMPTDNPKVNREKLVCVSLAAPFALALSRLISFLAPFRDRPIHHPDLHIQLAYTLSPRVLNSWSSFPSDHAMLFFTFAVGLLLVSKRIGLIALLYVSLIICLPRIYLGLHYPTDIMAGAFLGAGVAYVVCLPRVRSALARPVFRVLTAFPAAFYTFCFFYTNQIANSFGWVRDTVSFFKNWPGR